MATRLPAIDFVGLLNRVQAHNEKHKLLAERVEQCAKLLLDASQKVGRSHSGSWFGWHAEVYFANLSEPPLENRFSVEWGEVSSEHWRHPSIEQVEKRIEELAGAEFSSLKKDAQELADAMRAIQNDHVAELAPIHNVVGFEKEKALLDKLDGFKWEESKHRDWVRLMQDAAPRMTRDTDAGMQGFKVPPHVQCGAKAYDALAKAKSAVEFWTISVRLLKQLQVQASASMPESSLSGDALQGVLNICKRFNVIAKQLESRHDSRDTITISDEYDVQDLLHSLLRLHFDDVRREEPTPSFAGGSARIDVLIKSARIVIEAKMTRSNLKDKEIGNELLQDIARYKEHPDCSVLVCFVYDPLRLLKNPRGLEADLEKESSDRLAVKAIVTPP